MQLVSEFWFYWTKPVYNLYKAIEHCLVRIYQHNYTCHCSSHTKIHTCISVDVSVLYTCMKLFQLYYSNRLVQAVVVSMFLVLNLIFHNRCSKHWIDLWDQAAYRVKISCYFGQHDRYFKHNDSVGYMGAITSSGSNTSVGVHGLIS
jgi:hypothetical protein